MLTAAQVAEQLGISKRQVYYMVERGQLPHTKVTKQITRFEQADIDQFKAQNTKGGADGAAR